MAKSRQSAFLKHHEDSGPYEPTAETDNLLGLPAVGENKTPAPPEIRFAPASVDEQRRLAIPVLIAARAMVKEGEPLVLALAAAGDGRIVSEYARRAVRTVLKEPNLLGWQEHPGRTNHDVLRALDRAIALCRRKGHAGGWLVSSGPKAA